jgi:hypothetical protein
MVADSFTTTEPAYYMAQAIFAQTPSPASIKVIRGSTAITFTGDFTVTDLNVGDTIGFDMIGANGVKTSVTTLATGVANTDAATLAALTAPNGMALTNPGAPSAIVRVTASGTRTIGYIQNIRGGTWQDKTPTATYSTDITNALTIDTNWYGLAGAYLDATNIAALASIAETNKKLHCATTADTANLSASSGISNTLKGSSYAYTNTWMTGTPIGYPGCALMGQRFTATPGSDTWAYKQLANVAVDSWTATQLANLNGNNCNYYVGPVAGANITLTGIEASGLYADLRRGIDALGAQIQTNVFTLLTTLPKLPYDANGYAMIGGAIAQALQSFSASPSNPNALLRTDPGFMWFVTLPATTAAATSDRSQRILKGVQFTAWAQNAVQTVQITGVVNT